MKKKMLSMLGLFFVMLCLLANPAVAADDTQMMMDQHMYDAKSKAPPAPKVYLPPPPDESSASSTKTNRGYPVPQKPSRGYPVPQKPSRGYPVPQGGRTLAQ